jgi:uncharacterized protein (TIGR02722 family)
MTKQLILAAAAALLCACGTSVKRVDTGTTIDVSGRWNDADSRMSAEELIADCLSRPWISQAAADTGGKPTVIVGTVRNLSSEHIKTGILVEDLQRALINSGRVSFVASKDERGELRDERLEQSTNASEETRKAHGQEIGADFMLSGSINTLEDKEGGKSVILYQVDMKLLNVKTNQISWSGQKKLKKIVKRSGSGW